MPCDLHLHSTASDGTDTPADLPRLATVAGLDAIALTDHDTSAGLPACEAAAGEAGIGFIPGIELSADPSSIGSATRGQGADVRRGTLHLLGYFIRHDDPQLARVQDRLRKARAQRNPEMVERLNELGVKISYEEVVAAAAPGSVTGSAPAESGSDGAGGIIGRPHIAQIMLQKGYVKSIHEAFARYIGEGGAAYVRKDRLSAADAISALHAAGGLAFLAHPVQLRLSPDELDHAVRQLESVGLDGIETRHSDHMPADVDRFARLAARYGLLASGGSDYHGTRKRVALGGADVPTEVYEQLLAAREQAAAR